MSKNSKSSKSSKAASKPKSSKAVSKSPTRATTVPPVASKAAEAVVKSIPASTTPTTSAVTSAATPVVAKPVVATPATATVTSAAAKSVAAQSSVSAPIGETAVATPVVAPARDLQPLISQLNSDVAETAIEAIDALAATKDERAVGPIAEVLANFDGYFHVVTRAAAAMALGKLGHASAVQSLLNGAHDSQAEVSTESILALGELRATGAVSQLIEIVQNYNGYYLNVTRHAAIRALAKIGDASARETLTSVSENTWEDAAINSAARDALSQI